MDEIQKMDLTCLYGLDAEELSGLAEKESVPKFRGKQLCEWLYGKHIADLKEAKNLPADFRQRLSEKYRLHSLQFEKNAESSNLESKKFLFKTWDNDYLESVLISQKGRRTVCVSTQIGCKIGCTFCASGKGKFGRDLTAGEIVEQVIWIQKQLGESVTNVVFMGMGEPLDNFENTMKALKILQAKWGLGLGSRRITVSTSGLTPKMVEFVQRSEGRVRLSVSLHSSQEEKRSELVPINKKYSLKELTETLEQIYRKLKREITFEYTVIQGENDSEEEAHGVGRLAKSLKAKVNLIPYNPIQEMNYESPSEETMQNFRAILEQHGVYVTVRQTAGRDINAACGQLRRTATR